MSSPHVMPGFLNRPQTRDQDVDGVLYGASCSFTNSQLKKLLGTHDFFFQSQTKPSSGWWSHYLTLGPHKHLTNDPPTAPRAGRAPPPRPSDNSLSLPGPPGPRSVAASSRRGATPGFQGPDRGQWRAHHLTGHYPDLTTAFVPPRGIGTQQPQRALGTMCCCRLRRRRRRCLRRRPRAALVEMVTGLSNTKFGV